MEDSRRRCRACTTTYRRQYSREHYDPVARHAKYLKMKNRKDK